MKTRRIPCAVCGRGLRAVLDGQWVATTRAKRGLSYRALARLCGCSAPTISDIEKGRRNASAALARKIVSILEAK